MAVSECFECFGPFTAMFVIFIIIITICYNCYVFEMCERCLMLHLYSLCWQGLCHSVSRQHKCDCVHSP